MLMRHASLYSSCKYQYQNFRFLFTGAFQVPGYEQVVPQKNDPIIVAMSSGVDSSVAAAMAKNKYSNVKGIYMANWSQTAKCTEAEWNDVQKVCDKIGIDCERISFEKEYWINVFEPMIEMYKKGMTPNPDVNCNKFIKFGSMITALSEKLGPHKPWWLVTGHYARILKKSGTQNDYGLLRPVDLAKDQSYYLSTVPSEIFHRILLPMGHMKKSDVRKLAREFELPTSEKPDSQGLCFVGQDGNFRDFLNEYIDANPGNIVTEDGKVFGKHQGLWHATIGQRCGISMPQGDPRYKGVWFVSEKRFDSNELVIVKGTDNPALFKDTVWTSDWIWMGKYSESVIIDMLRSGKMIWVQYRSLQKQIQVADLAAESGNLKVILSEKSRGIAPGQNLVIYDSDGLVLGCGLIVNTGVSDQ